MRSATKKRTGRDKKYLEWLHSLPCVVCDECFDYPGVMFQSRGYLIEQKSDTEAAHVGERGLSQKCPDHEAIPLCMEHHREGKFSSHRMGRRFWAHWGLDKNSLISELNERYEREQMHDTQAVSLRGIDETLSLLLEVDPAELTPEMQADLELQIRETVLARGEKLDRIAGRLFQLGQRAAVKRTSANAHSEKAAKLLLEAARSEADAKRLGDYVLAVMREMPKPKKGAIKVEGETSTFTAKCVPASLEITDPKALPNSLQRVMIEIKYDDYIALPREVFAVLGVSATMTPAPKAEIKQALEVMVDCPHCGGRGGFHVMRLELEGRKGKGFRRELRFDVTFEEQDALRKLEAYMMQCDNARGSLGVKYLAEPVQEVIPENQMDLEGSEE